MRTKKIKVLFSMVCVMSALATGCSFHLSPADKDSAGADGGMAAQELSDRASADHEEEAENAADAEMPQENTEGKWHVLDPETAAAVDADFVGTVQKIDEGAFYIVEQKVQILDDGSIAGSSFSSKVNIPDSWLIQVVFDDDTYFYKRTIYGNGESYEDAQAGFGDLQEDMSVEMKGRFENDVFYATQIRIIKIS